MNRRRGVGPRGGFSSLRLRAALVMPLACWANARLLGEQAASWPRDAPIQSRLVSPSQPGWILQTDPMLTADRKEPGVALRPDCRAPDSEKWPRVQGAVEILAIREVIGSGAEESFSEENGCVRVRASDGETGWVPAESVWPVSGIWPASWSLVKSEPCLENDHGNPLCRRFVGETLVGGNRPRRSDRETIAVVSSAMRRRQAQLLMPNGLSRDLRLAGVVTNDGCAGNWWGVVFSRDSAPQENGLVLLAEEPLGAEQALVRQLPPETTLPGPPTTGELNGWYRERVGVERPVDEGPGEPSCRWHPAFDVYGDGTVDLVGTCIFISPTGRRQGLFWVEMRPSGWAPRLVRLRTEPRPHWSRTPEDPPEEQWSQHWNFFDPLVVVVTDINHDGRIELWIRANLEYDLGSNPTWLLFFDLGSAVHGPIVMTEESYDC